METLGQVACGTVKSISELIGNTPMIDISSFCGSLKASVFAKVEYFNPSGSLKDRIALAFINDAEERGFLRPGGTIVEPSSGNTGAALAMVCALRGYRCIVVTPEKTSAEKIGNMRAYGAEVVVAPNVPVSDPLHYTNQAAKLAASIQGAYMPDQYSNPANVRACESIGEEIWEQSEGRVTHVVAGLGTGGTACGIAISLRRKQPLVRIIGVDPVGSIYSGGPARPYEVEGIGRHHIPETLDLSLIDEIEMVSDAEAFEMTRALVHTTGLLVGGSSGAAAVAAKRVSSRLDQDAYIAVVMPDSGRSYVSKIFRTREAAPEI